MIIPDKRQKVTRVTAPSNVTKLSQLENDVGFTTQARVEEVVGDKLATAPPVTPASIGAATAAQGAKADTAMQSMPTITPASIGAATAAQGAKADTAVQPAAIANFITASQIPAAAKVHEITAGANGAATFTFPTPYTTVPKVLPIESWVGEQMYVAGVVSVTATNVSVVAKRSRGTLLLTTGPFETAPSGSKVQIAVLP